MFNFADDQVWVRRAAICFLVGSAGLFSSCTSAESETVKLACSGEMRIKHYDEQKSFSSSAQIDIHKGSLVLYFAETTYQLDTKGGPLTSKQDVESLDFKIYEIKKPFYFLEKVGTVNDNAIVMNKSWFGNYYEVKIKSDDVAKGFLNADTGKLEIETRYYRTTGDEFEYGWFLEAECNKSQSVIE